MAKNSKLIVLVLIISLILNWFFVSDEIRLNKYRMSVNMELKDFAINPSSEFDKELNLFFANHPERPYIFISTWADFCKPCLKEMPLLDSIVDSRKKWLSCYFVTDVTKPGNKAFDSRFKNFKILYHQNNLISALHKKFGILKKTYPLNCIIDRSLHVYFFEGQGIDFKRDTVLQRVLAAIPADL